MMIKKPRFKGLKEILFYAALFLFSVVSYVIFTPLYDAFGGLERGEAAKCLALILLLGLTAIGFVLHRAGELSRKRLIFLFILASFAIRLGYILYTEGDCRQHDTWGDVGHFAYADILFKKGILPETNDYQFYHPPLNALIQSVFMHIFEGLFSFLAKAMPLLPFSRYWALNSETYFIACQTLSLLYITVTTVYACKIIKALGIRGKAGLIAIIFLCFYPRLVQFSGQLNNDALCLMLSFIALYCAILYYKVPSFKNIVITGIFVGLAMMTKLNGATICFTIAVLFVLVFIKSIKTKEWRPVLKTVAQFAVFLSIAAPIGLWFQVYAAIRFDQGFGFVFSNLNPNLSTAHIPLFYRFFLPSAEVIFSSPFANAWEDYNLIDYMLKSSLFGEFSFWNGTAFAALAVFFNYVFSVLFVITFVLFIINRKKQNKKIFDLPVIVLLPLMLSLLVSQVIFYIKMPYGCTMDFRYVVPLILSGGGITALMYKEAKSSSIKAFEAFASFNAYSAISIVCLTSIFYLVCI